jgi:hypothetical protein
MTVGQLKAAGAVAVAWLFWYLYTHPAKREATVCVDVLEKTCTFGEPISNP